MSAPNPTVSDEGEEDQSSDLSSQTPGSRRTACVICRRRKLKCDGAAPACARCARLGHQCSYDLKAMRSGPRKGYVRGLESRLAQVETLLKNRETEESNAANSTSAEAVNELGSNDRNFTPMTDFTPVAGSSFDLSDLFAPDCLSTQAQCDNFFGMSTDAALCEVQEEQITWDLMELGLSEPLPLPEVLDELTQLYFDKVHPFVPIIHQYRFMAAMSLSPLARPPIALRYAMWTLAASATIKYSNLQDHFYLRARKYAEAVEMLGHGEKVQNTAHTQAEILIGLYEFKSMNFPRAWLRTGRAVRLVQMMGLNRLDSERLYVEKCIPPARDCIEQEERRRTFWMTFCMDRYATTGSGWPMIIDERDIFTNLPCSEEAYQQGIQTHEMTLHEAMIPSRAKDLSSFGGVIVVTSIFGRALTHLHRPAPDDREEDLNGEFWKRHRNLDNALLTMSLYLPSHLRLPSPSANSNTVFLNMCLHGATICLHQVAQFKAEKYQMLNILEESRIRCLTAAAGIATTMRTIAHMDLTSMNPFMPFSLYIAARIFVQCAKMQPNDDNAKSSVQFLMFSMAVLRSTNPMADTFLAQLELEVEGMGIESPPRYPQFDLPAFPDDPLDGTPWLKIAPPLVNIIEIPQYTGAL